MQGKCSRLKIYWDMNIQKSIKKGVRERRWCSVCFLLTLLPGNLLHLRISEAFRKLTIPLATFMKANPDTEACRDDHCPLSMCLPFSWLRDSEKHIKIISLFSSTSQ